MIVSFRSMASLCCIPLLAQSVPSSQTFAQRVLAEEPEVRKLIEALKPLEALARMEALLPVPRPAFDAKDANTTHISSLRALYLSRAYLLAMQAAELSGQWEKARDFALEGVAVAKENAEQCEKVLTPMVAGFRKQAAEAKAFLEANKEALKALEGKQSVSEEEWNLLERAKVEQPRLAEGEKWSRFFQEDLDRSKADRERWPQDLPEAMSRKIADQEKEISSYKAAKGDKVKWAEAVVAAPQYMAAYSQPREKVAFLHRLLVLAPGSAKIRRALDAALEGGMQPVKPSTKGQNR